MQCFEGHSGEFKPYAPLAAIAIGCVMLKSQLCTRTGENYGAEAKVVPGREEDDH